MGEEDDEDDEDDEGEGGVGLTRTLLDYFEINKIKYLKGFLFSSGDTLLLLELEKYFRDFFLSLLCFTIFREDISR